jgi:DNA-directed RNA polymerase subunit RPC12/RpoP
MLVELLISFWVAQRAGHIAISKGRRAWPYRLIAFMPLLLSYVCSFLSGVVIGLIALIRGSAAAPEQLAFVVGALMMYGPFALFIYLYFRILRCLDAMPGAPGETYLQISFPCSQCRQMITFRRDQMNQLVTCPKCKKKTMVPEESQPPLLQT